MKLSVITVNYRNLNGLRRTIESVLCQSWTDFDHIVVDGGSEDGTKELLLSYEAKYASRNIKLMWRSEPDNGIYCAMNKAVQMAHGEYCNFLNSGDTYANSEVLKNVFAEYNPHDVLIGYATTVSRIIPPPEHVSISFFYKHGSINHQAAFIRRELLEQHPYDKSGIISADYKFFMETLLLQACSYRPLQTMVVKFDNTGLSSQPENLKKIRKEQTQMLQEHYNIAELEDARLSLYDDYAIVRWAKRFTGFLVRLRHRLRLSTYDTNLIGNIHPSKALLLRRMLRKNAKILKWRLTHRRPDRMKESALNSDKRDIPLIVTLTSYPARMSTLAETLSSLMQQSVKPDRLILWLTAEQFPRREADIPIEILNLRRLGLTIAWCDRPIRSYTKLLPTLLLYPDAVLVVADDDILYQKDWLKGLYDAYLEAPRRIHCYDACKVGYEGGKLLPYNTWKHFTEDAAGYNILPLGVGGVLYPPHAVHSDVLLEEKYRRLAPTTDDLWFWTMALMNNTEIQMHYHRHNSSPMAVFGVDNTNALFNENSIGQNDIQLQNIINEYPHILDYLKK